MSAHFEIELNHCFENQVNLDMKLTHYLHYFRHVLT